MESSRNNISAGWRPGTLRVERIVVHDVNGSIAQRTERTPPQPLVNARLVELVRGYEARTVLRGKGVQPGNEVGAEKLIPIVHDTDKSSRRSAYFFGKFQSGSAEQIERLIVPISLKHELIDGR